MDREACHAAIHWVAKSWAWLSDWTDWTEKVIYSAVQKDRGCVQFHKYQKDPSMGPVATCHKVPVME